MLVIVRWCVYNMRLYNVIIPVTCNGIQMCVAWINTECNECIDQYNVISK